MKLHKIIILVFCLGILSILSACGGGSSGANSSSGGGNGGTTLFSLGGTVSGLNSGNQVVFQVVINDGSNSADTTNSATVSTNGTFATPAFVPANGSYVVLVTTQPGGQTCTVSNAAGSNVTANVTNISVVCSATTFSVSGTVSGLLAGQQVTLLNNYADPLNVSSNSTFKFVTPVASGGGYHVTVKTAPLMTTCTVTYGSGSNVSANIVNVNVSCAVSESVLYSFKGFPDAYDPQVKLIQAGDGNFYGTTGLGGNAGDSLGRGAVFMVTPLGAETVLHSFSGSTSDGSCPQAGLVQGTNGNLYGTTCLGGQYNYGTVYSLTLGTNSTETLLYSFGSVASQGRNPYAELIQASDGNFYGTTTAGGTTDQGTFFQITPAGVETVLHTFGELTGDGHYPHATLVQGSDGNFYGTTYSGGASNNGTVYVVTASGQETLLHSFGGSGAADGSMTVTTAPSNQQTVWINPSATLVQGLDGNFYGTTPSGGAYNNGTVFMITPTGTEKVLYSFAPGTADGQGPQAGLLLASDGYFYGTTVNGGKNGLGAVFRIDTAGHETLMYSFNGSPNDGAYPYASLTQGADGHLYTTTYQGGTGYGAVVKF